MASLAWYVAGILSKSERIAELNLARQGFVSFCPRFRKTRRHARRVEQVLVPLFPGYLFVRFDYKRDQWRSINGTLGVTHLIGPVSSRPQAMPEWAMEALFERCDNGIVRSLLPDLEPGRRVRIGSGPFESQMATIDCLDDRGRVAVLLNILGGQTTVKVAVHDLVPV